MFCSDAESPSERPNQAVKAWKPANVVPTAPSVATEAAVALGAALAALTTAPAVTTPRLRALLDLPELADRECERMRGALGAGASLVAAASG